MFSRQDICGRFGKSRGIERLIEQVRGSYLHPMFLKYNINCKKEINLAGH